MRKASNVRVLAAGSVLILSSVLTAQTPLHVSIDVKPGDTPTVIETDRQGMIPVAILTTPQFNAANVEPTTVRFGPTGTEAEVFRAMLDDVDQDGDLDRLLLFRLQDVGVSCTTTGDAEVLLKGKTTDGRAFEGSEKVKVECRNADHE